MVDLEDVRRNPQKFQTACDQKRIKFDVAAFLALDQDRRTRTKSLDEMRARQNQINKEMPKLSGAEREPKLAEVKELSKNIKAGAEELKGIEESWERQRLLIPSVPLPNVPQGKDDSENVEVRKWGEPPKFSFTPKDHVALGKDLGIIDLPRGAKVSGARNYYLKGDGARLQRAVLNFAMEFISKRGYELFEPPHIVGYQAMMGTGYFPGGEEMAYHLDERDADKYLIGTSEVSLVSFFAEENIPAASLPIRCAGYSPCYRREAGSYGKDTHGLYRVHQFYKVEQVVICEADEATSLKMHKELLGNSEDLLQALGVPYRVVDVCSGDLGQGQVYKNDIEAWMPSREKYSETHSCSSLYAFQARRLGIKYTPGADPAKYCFTLNNTLIASPRILIPLLELNQQADGSVVIPPALRPYMGGQEKISR